jgi:predicted aspartyl protease
MRRPLVVIATLALLAPLAGSTEQSAQAEGAAPPRPAQAAHDAAAAVSVGEGPLFASPTTRDRIGRIVAPVVINGRGPYRLVVDTGASRSTISPELAAALELTPSAQEPMLLNGITGSARVPTVRIERMQAGSLVIEATKVPVVWSSIMAGADGILGVAGLTRERIQVDFRRDRVVVAQSMGAPQLVGYLRIPAKRVAGGLLVVDAKIGRVKVKAVIDTGAERSLGNRALREALYGVPVDDSPGRTQVLGATPEIALGHTSAAPPIVLGDATVNDVQVTFGDFHVFGVWGLRERPAVVIGMDVLGAVDSLVIDFRRAELYVRA